MKARGVNEVSRRWSPPALLVAGAIVLVCCGKSVGQAGSGQAAEAGMGGSEPAAGAGAGNMNGGVNGGESGVAAGGESGAGPSNAAGCGFSHCGPQTCVPGRNQCQNGDLYVCSADGSGFQLSIDCAENNVCDSNGCVPRVCQAGDVGCHSTRPTKCNDPGSKLVDTGEDCAERGLICYRGQCKSGVCQPGDSECVGSVVYVCNDEGTVSAPFQDCEAAQAHCESFGPTTVGCKPRVCTPSLATCDGNSLKTCNEFGTAIALTTDCGDDVCDNGACKPKTCEPGTTVCLDGDVQLCDFPGLQLSVVVDCPDSAPCAAIGNELDCSARPCTPGTTTCVGNARGTCALDGGSLQSVAEDCAAGSLACDVSGTCAASVVDVAGLAEDLAPLEPDPAVGDVIDVFSDRRLIKLEADLQLDTPRDLSWAVYEYVPNDGFTLVASDVTTANGGSGFFASGPLNYVLLAGQRYFFSVATVSEQGLIQRDQQPWQTTLSFGALVHSAFRSPGPGSAASYDYGNIYRFRFTTELP